MEMRLFWILAILSMLLFILGLSVSYVQAQAPVNSTNQTGLGNMTTSTLTPSGNLTNRSSALITNTT
jgi:hypothetical protein